MAFVCAWHLARVKPRHEQRNKNLSHFSLKYSSGKARISDFGLAFHKESPSGGAICCIPTDGAAQDAAGCAYSTSSCRSWSRLVTAK